MSFSLGNRRLIVCSKCHSWCDVLKLLVEKIDFISLTLASSPLDFMSMPSVDLIPVAGWMINSETSLNLNK
ncbi:hypothetical protein VCR9J2_10221 [Vibrio crassostreae]|nr:hypothetical protein VCR9J2_10221 [Vibrio crassostreae]